MIRHGQETVIFPVNNRGYVSESAGSRWERQG